MHWNKNDSQNIPVSAAFGEELEGIKGRAGWFGMAGCEKIARNALRCLGTDGTSDMTAPDWNKHNMLGYVWTS